MHSLFNLTGTLVGLVGALFCLVAGITRLAGAYHLAGLEATTIFLVGTGLMVFACLLKLEVLVAIPGRG
jgi:hypothetical protein